MNLTIKIKSHDWESMDARDLAERIDLLNEIVRTPQNELAAILKELTPNKASIVMKHVAHWTASKNR